MTNPRVGACERRPSPPLTAESVQRITHRYLERYFTTAHHLRRLLMRRARASIEAHGGELDELVALIDAEIERLVASGALDDRQFAEGRARSMNRRGVASGRIRSALAGKGVDGETAGEAVAALRDHAEDPDWEAAQTWSRKRRIGPWRVGPLTLEVRQRELARLGRAGFSYALARRIVDGER
jgi:regulatory protein